MLNLAEIFCINNVKTGVEDYMLRNFDQLITNKQYMKLTLTQMAFFLKSNRLRVFPEIRVFNATINWLKNKKKNSKKKIPEKEESKTAVYQLMESIRFHTMKPEEFVDIVAKTDLIKDDISCNSLLIEAYEYFSLPNRQFCSNSARSLIRAEPVRAY
jgi:hypothetical protein